MFHSKLLYAAIGGATVLIVKGLVGKKDGARPVVKNVYKGIARVNRGFERMAAEIREDLEDARQELEREEATQQPV
jgi:hypothetical protein